MRSPSAKLALALLPVALFGSACAEPLQNGGVYMFDGVDARIGAMCRFRKGAEGKEGFCAPEAEGPVEVKLARIEGEGPGPLAGARAEGKKGDYVMDNGEIAVVISADGAIVDAGDARVRKDELGRLSACLGGALGCLTNATLEAGHEGDGSAWVVARGQARGDERVKIATRYALLPAARAVLITTVVSSKADAPIEVAHLGDEVVWGSAEQVIPGPSGASELPFVAAVGGDVAYAITPAEEASALSLESGPEAASVRLGQGGTLAPGKGVRYKQVFLVAPRGDSLGVLTELALVKKNIAPGAVEVRFVDAAGKPVPAPAGGRVRLGSSTEIPAFLQIGQAQGEPTVAAEAPPGHYELELEAQGLRALAKTAADVRSGEVTSVTMTVGAAEVAPQAPAPSPAP